MNHPIDRSKSSGDAAYDALMAALRDGTYEPGTRLREEEVAEKLGFSRTPVREALRQLEAHGIVEHKPRIGAVVRTLQHAEIVELYEMRVMFERNAAMLAAKHAVDAEIDALIELNEQVAAHRDDPARSAALNQSFHLGLYHAGRNRFLLEAARTLNNSLLLVGPTTYKDPDRIERVVSEHKNILDALVMGDAEAAAQAAEIHIKSSLTYRLKAKAF